MTLAEAERTHVEEALRDADGNLTWAATALGVRRRTLQRKLKSYKGALFEITTHPLKRKR